VNPNESPQASLANAIPTIRISTESDGDRNREAVAKEQLQGGRGEKTEEEAAVESEDGDLVKVNSMTQIAHDTLEKPFRPPRTILWELRARHLHPRRMQSLSCSATSDCARGGWTTFSWFCMRCNEDIGF
jgi:hypothetical protein